MFIMPFDISNDFLKKHIKTKIRANPCPQGSFLCDIFSTSDKKSVRKSKFLPPFFTVL